MEKNYIFLDSKEILRREIDKIKDIYFYDDTHWTPKASKLIAEEIEKNIK
jgi:alpha-N-acetylglucosamine transferase